MSGYVISQKRQVSSSGNVEYAFHLELDLDASKSMDVTYCWCRKDVIEVTSIDEQGLEDLASVCIISLFDYIFEWCIENGYYMMDNCDFITDVYAPNMSTAACARMYREEVHGSGLYDGKFSPSLAHKRENGVQDYGDQNVSASLKVVLLPWHASTADFWAKLVRLCNMSITNNEDLESALVELHGGKHTSISRYFRTLICEDWSFFAFLQSLIKSAPELLKNECNWHDYSVLPLLCSQNSKNNYQSVKPASLDNAYTPLQSLLVQVYNITASNRLQDIESFGQCARDCVSLFQSEFDFSCIKGGDTPNDSQPTCFTTEKSGFYVDPVSNSNKDAWSPVLQLSRPTVCAILASTLLGDALYTTGSSCLARSQNADSSLNYYRTVESVKAQDKDILDQIPENVRVQSRGYSAGSLSQLFNTQDSTTREKVKCLRVYFIRMQHELTLSNSLGALEIRLGSIRVDLFAIIVSLCLDSVFLTPEQRIIVESYVHHVYQLDGIYPYYVVGEYAQEILAFIALNSQVVPKGAAVGCTYDIPVKKNDHTYSVKSKYLNTNNQHQLKNKNPDYTDMLEQYDLPVISKSLSSDEKQQSSIDPSPPPPPLPAVTPTINNTPKGILKFYTRIPKSSVQNTAIRTNPAIAAPTIKPLCLTVRDQAVQQLTSPTYPPRITLEDDLVAGPLCDFANKYIGGGVLRHGCVQEEILFVIFPECLLSIMVCERMNTSTAISISGARQFSTYTGYSSSFQCAGPYCRCPTLSHTECKTKIWRQPYRLGGTMHENNVESLIVAIDALHFPRNSDIQFDPLLVWREFVKVAAGHSQPTGVRTTLKEAVVANSTPFRAPVSCTKTHQTDGFLINYEQFATGNWGCGAFNGDRQQKAIVQLLACTCFGKTMKYFTLDDEPIQSISAVLGTIYSQNISLRKLFIILSHFLLLHPRANPYSEIDLHKTFSKDFKVYIPKEQYLPACRGPQSRFREALLKQSKEFQNVCHPHSDKRLKLDTMTHDFPTKDQIRGMVPSSTQLFTFLNSYVKNIFGGIAPSPITLPTKIN